MWGESEFVVQKDPKVPDDCVWVYGGVVKKIEIVRIVTTHMKYVALSRGDRKFIMVTPHL